MTTRFPDPASYDSIPVYDLLKAAARGYASADLRLLRSIVNRGEQVLPDIVRFGMEDHDDDRVDLEAELIALVRQFHAPEVVPFLVECVRRRPGDIPDDLIDAIIPYAGEALEPLLALYNELEEGESAELAFVLAGLRIRDDRILNILLERLEYDTGDGAIFLGLYRDPAALPALERILPEVPKRDVELRKDIQTAIDDIRNPGPQTEFVNQPPDLAGLFPETMPIPDEVLDHEDMAAMLESDSLEHRLAAAAGLRDHKLEDEVLKAVLDHARNDPNPEVRGRCWEALADVDSPEIRKSMKQVAADGEREPAERGGAIVGLCSATADREVATRLREFYAVPELRAKALEAMWRSFDRQFATLFAKHLHDPDLDVRRQAILGVGYMGIGAEAGKLRDMFEDSEFRHDALYAYALCSPGEFSRTKVRGILRKIDALAGHLSEAETGIVHAALDQRLIMNGMEPVFSVEYEAQDEGPQPGPRLVKNDGPAPGRNDPCPCGSGIKYKKCHGA